MAEWASVRRLYSLTTRLDDKMSRTAQEAARRKFSPEFMNRIDKVVVFKTLRPEHLQQILEIELGMVQQRILQATGNNQFVFSCTSTVKEYLLRGGYGRQVRRASFEASNRTPYRVPSWRISSPPDRSSSVTSCASMLTRTGELKFVKEAEGALVPVLLEKYGPEFSAPAPAKAARSAVGRRELGANSNDHK